MYIVDMLNKCIRSLDKSTISFIPGLNQHHHHHQYGDLPGSHPNPQSECQSGRAPTGVLDSMQCQDLVNEQRTGHDSLMLLRAQMHLLGWLSTWHPICTISS